MSEGAWSLRISRAACESAVVRQCAARDDCPLRILQFRRMPCYNLISVLAALDNVLLPLRLAGRTSHAQKARARELLVPSR